MKPIIVPGLKDKVLKTRYRGEVLDLSTNEVICYVYGETIDIMRERKHFIAKALREK